MLTHIFGLDLGQAQDFSALAMLEQSRQGESATARYGVVHLHRWQLNTSYPQVVSDVAAMVLAPGVQNVCLAIDATGVGRPIVDLFVQADLPAAIYPVLITAGNAAKRADDGYYHVAKQILVATMRSLGDRGLIQFSKDLQLTPTVKKETRTFTAKITNAGNETFAADWREGEHDDLVLATAIAAWVGENVVVGPFTVPDDPEGRSVIDRAPEGVFLTNDFDDEREGRDDDGLRFPW